MRYRNLSPAETKVAKLVLEGLKSSVIAAKLGIKEKTVKFHLTNIYRIEQVENRAELIVKFLGRSR